ncbi:TPA: hypothetical protein N3288_000231 [Klebsiella aerogenes]|nr:hypothetical protein [Klebsiella aerogenes]
MSIIIIDFGSMGDWVADRFNDIVEALNILPYHLGWIILACAVGFELLLPPILQEMAEQKAALNEK